MQYSEHIWVEFPGWIWFVPDTYLLWEPFARPFVGTVLVSALRSFTGLRAPRLHVLRLPFCRNRSVMDVGGISTPVGHASDVIDMR